ncbi:Nitrate transporter 1.7 [Apostasia shenzhenica]|uniref:Nitrate transporter 1.7 n=1 Tax=Apostasia shenzhenica TaxID=1088818 RepID=A0A2I0AP87_9ASPA|nr:Nitrate transporter 1.7 [Apostasia shenzhenica]
MVALTVTAAVPALRPPICKDADQLHGQCAGPSPSHFGFLILSLVFLAAGAGGVRPCSLPFGVDQFDQSAGLGRRDLASFFNWYYCTSTAGVIAGMTAVVYVQDSVGWPLGFAVPAACMLISIVALFMGTRLYVYVSPQGSVFSGVAQVFVASYRKRRLHLPAANDAGRQEAVLYNPPAPSGQRFVRLSLSLQFSFLNKAAIKCEEDAVTESGEPINPWKLCGVQTVEEVKCLLRIAPIWAAGVVFFLAVSQQWTFTVLQSLSMDRRLPLAGAGDLRIPAAAVSVISLMSLALFIPVYDRLLVPLLRRATGRDAGVTLLQRQGAGLLLSVVSMAVAGVVEGRRRRSGGREMSAVKWLSPQLVLMGIAEGLNAVGQVEFYNRQFPERMQTVAGSLFYCSIAGGGYLSGALVSIVDKATGGGQRRGWLDKDLDAGRLDYFYYLIAGMGAVNLVYFLVCARFYRYKGEAVLGAIGGEAEGGGRSLMEMGEEEGRGCW